MELLKSPFLNDPSSLVAQAFAEIYPGTAYEAILVDKSPQRTAQKWSVVPHSRTTALSRS